MTLTSTAQQYRCPHIRLRSQAATATTASSQSHQNKTSGMLTHEASSNGILLNIVPLFPHSFQLNERRDQKIRVATEL